MNHAIFMAATGQHVGKTTLSLGIVAGLIKRYEKVGFIKPVGQQHVKVKGKLEVDKDVVLFRERFNLDIPYADMSPVIVPSGFTRRYLDGKEDAAGMGEKIQQAFARIRDTHDYTVVEGTGHVGVGEVIGLNNARVAKLLGIDMVIVATGGLGSTIDELALNIAMCHQEGVKVRGVILNKVIEEKLPMIKEYVPKALARWDIPLLGCIPYNNFLGTPAVRDFASLFKTELIAGHNCLWRHFKHARLVAGSLESYRDEIFPNQLIITPASREDIVEATLETHVDTLERLGIDFEGGMILTGRRAPSAAILEKIKEVDLPCVYAPLDSYTAMQKITSFVAKTAKEDTKKIKRATALVEDHINFELL